MVPVNGVELCMQAFGDPDDPARIRNVVAPSTRKC